MRGQKQGAILSYGFDLRRLNIGIKLRTEMLTVRLELARAAPLAASLLVSDDLTGRRVENYRRKARAVKIEHVKEGSRELVE
jgi:hypothetical protein